MKNKYDSRLKKKVRYKKNNYDNNLNFKRYQKTIKQCTNNIWIPNNFDNDELIKTDSWFSLRKKVNKDEQSVINFKKDIKRDKCSSIMKCKQIKLSLTQQQKNIMNDWFNAYTIMYNKTLKYIKNNYNNDDFKLNFMNLRTYCLKDIRNDIIENSQNKHVVNKNTKIKTHVIDQAIKLAVSNYKSALSNLKNNKIKHFRIRYWRFKRTNKILHIEKTYFSKGTLCNNVFGKIKGMYNNKEYLFDDIEHDSTLKYDKYQNKYTLYVPQKINIIDNENTKKISLDPGLRTFLTGMSNNEVVEIGENGNKYVKEYINRLDNSNKIKDDKKKEKKKEMLKRKLKNKINDLHWKSIKHLTKNYKTVFIGNMSVKSIIRKGSNLSKLNKRIATSYEFFKFHQRLEYKCMLNDVQLYVIDESYTSKTCSVCGWYNKDLKSEKIYDCQNCKLKIDRDINGCRGICIKSGQVVCH